LRSVSPTDSRILHAYPSLSAAGIRPKSVLDWLLAESAARRIIVARTLWREHLLVIRPLDGKSLAHRRFGLLQHAIPPDQTP